MSLENKLEQMGIFSFLHKKSSGVAKAAAFATALNTATVTIPEMNEVYATENPIKYEQVDKKLISYKNVKGRDIMLPLITRDTVFKDFPVLSEVVTKMYEGDPSGSILEKLNPNSRYQNLRLVSLETTQTIEYALVLRAALAYNEELNWNIGNIMRNPQKYSMNKITNPMTKLVRYALDPTNKTPENDLYIALGYATSGDPKWGIPIVENNYPKWVNEKVREWKIEHDFSPYSEENMQLLVYLSNAMKKKGTKIKNPNSTEIILNLLTEYYDFKPETARVIHNHIAVYLRNRNIIKNYTIPMKNGNENSFFRPFNVNQQNIKKRRNAFF